MRQVYFRQLGQKLGHRTLLMSESRSTCRLLYLHQIAFSVNIASAFAYATLVYVSRSQTYGNPQNDTVYYLLRAAFRIDDLLHLPSITPVSTAAVARQLPSRWSQVGVELLIVVTVCAVSALLLFLSQSIGRSQADRWTNSLFPGLTALFALPACCLYVSNLTWRWSSEPLSMRPRAFVVIAIEILSLGILLAIYRKRPFHPRAVGVLLLLHYAYWVPVLWMEISTNVYLYTPRLLLISFPLFGFVWLIHLKNQDSNVAATEDGAGVGKWALVTAAVTAAILFFAWAPTKGKTLALARDMGSVTVQLSRGPCYGSCPSYTITIHGDGLVEYIGGRHVKVQGPQTGVVSHEQVINILASLDRAEFWSLEDRAFAWCFDSDSVSVSVSIDGETKRVVSDGGCTGAKSGLQARFVQSAAEIDSILGSDKWVSCDGPCWK